MAQGGLRKWVQEKWVDIGAPKKNGKYQILSFARRSHYQSAAITRNIYYSKAAVYMKDCTNCTKYTLGIGKLSCNFN